MGRVVIPGFRKIETSVSGEGGTTNYNDLENKPSINNVPLVGNLNTVNLKLTDATLTEEGVPAEAKTVGTKLEEQSTSLTALSEQLGNHTVKSDVPENAVFTDTIYDDTEVKESIDELNSNLNDLAYGERSGNKNLLDVSKIKGMSGAVRYGDYGFNNTSSDTRTTSVPFFNLYDGYTLVAGGKTLTKNPSSGIVKAYETFTTDQPINRINIGHSGAVNNCTVLFNMNLPAGTYTISMDIVKDNPSIVGGFEFKNIQIEEGDTATPYKPYIPSVKMLADEVSAQNESLSVIGKCKNLLNPTIGTTTQNGVTCTNNGDGTYTLNGTAKGQSAFTIPVEKTLKKGTKILGCINGSSTTYFITYRTGSNWSGKYDYGNGYVLQDDTIINDIDIIVRDGQTVSNIIFKPMITTNLNATYDDFVPYTGDGETLTEDVAELKNDLSGNDKVVIPLLNSCTGNLYYHKIGDLIVVNGVVNIPKANENVKVAVLPNSKVSQANAFTIYNFTDDTHDSEYATRYASDGSLVVKVPIANKDYIISGCYIGN